MKWGGAIAALELSAQEIERSDDATLAGRAAEQRAAASFLRRDAERFSRPSRPFAHTLEYDGETDVFIIDGVAISGGVFHVFAEPPPGLHRFSRGEDGAVHITLYPEPDAQ